MFTNRSSFYFVFSYSAELIISDLYVTSICNRPLLPVFVFTHNLYQLLGDEFYILLICFSFSCRLFRRVRKIVKSEY
jgi:hypothetical protein